MEKLLALLLETDDIDRYLAVAGLVGARVSPLLLLAPWLSFKATPTFVRTALTVAFTVVYTPLVLSLDPVVPEAALFYGVALIREAFVGALFAVTVSIPFYAVEWTGRLTDTWRGASMAEIIAPPTGERSSPLGALLLFASIVLFISIGGHRLALRTFFDTFVSLPVGTPTNLSPGFGLGVLQLVTQALTFAVALAAPIAVSIVLVEIALGLVAKSSPQVPVFFAGMPLRAATGLAALLLILSITVSSLPDGFASAIGAASNLVESLR